MKVARTVLLGDFNKS